MVDSGKLDTKMFHPVCDLNQLYAIITDLQPNHQKLKEYATSGVKLI
jgi:DeoR/GlpR family transcriptional regulator of sugar metabolism